MIGVMFSIHPEQVEKIFEKIGERDGEAVYRKNVELRKNRPRLKAPFPGYIYETAKNGGRGMVVGEFICDQIYTVAKDISEYMYIGDDELDYFSEAEEKGLDICLSDYELDSYLNNGLGYGLHITGLVKYSEPIGLEKFSKLGFGKWVPLKRPPQSWCYVEKSGV